MPAKETKQGPSISKEKTNTSERGEFFPLLTPGAVFCSLLIIGWCFCVYWSAKSLISTFLDCFPCSLLPFLPLVLQKNTLAKRCSPDHTKTYRFWTTVLGCFCNISRYVLPFWSAIYFRLPPPKHCECQKLIENGPIYQLYRHGSREQIRKHQIFHHWLTRWLIAWTVGHPTFW